MGHGANGSDLILFHVTAYGKKIEQVRMHNTDDLS
jgi:hypothetical protein